MLSLEEINKIVRQYRFKYEYSTTREHTLINTTTKQYITDKEEADRAKAAILLRSLIDKGCVPSGNSTKLAGVAKEFYGTDDIQTRSEMFLNSLVSDLSQIIKGQQHSSVNVSFFGVYKTPADLFIFSHDGQEPYMQDCYLSVFNLIAKDIGYKIDDLHFTNEGTEMLKNVVCKSHKDNTLQNNSSKNITQEQKAKRKKFAEWLIEKYKQIEDDDNYEIRSKNENATMLNVVKVANGELPLNELPSTTHRFMRMLIAAQNLSINGQRDFLEEFLSIDIVNEKLVNFKKDKEFQKRINDIIASKKANNEKTRHYETYGETARRLSNYSASHNPGEFERIKNIVNKKEQTITLSDLSDNTTDKERYRRIAELYATTQGKFNLYKKEDVNSID